MIKEVLNLEKRFNENRVCILKSLLDDNVISHDEYKLLVRLELGFEQHFMFEMKLPTIKTTNIDLLTAEINKRLAQNFFNKI